MQERNESGRMKNNIKLLVQIGGILIGSVLVGTILLIHVYALPTNEMKNNVQRSTAIYDYEGVYPQLMAGYKMSQLDNSTDATMLLGAIYPGSGNLLEDAMKVQRIEYSERHPVGSLTDYANDVQRETYTIAYPRYWHGYLVILKPLLLFFDVADIRMLNMFFLIAVVLCILDLMKKRGMSDYIIWFVVTLITLNPITIPLSFQFSTVTYIALLSSIAILKHNSWNYRKQIFLFLTIGIVTAYFDFFTFPLVGLYFPMIFLLIKETEWKKAIKTVIVGSIMWIIGYAGMWSGKWLVGSLLTGENFFVDALSRAGHYAGAEDVTRIQIILKNIMVLVKWPILFLAFFVISRLSIALLNGMKSKTLNWMWGIPFFIIVLAPFSWYVVAGSHSYIHYWFTYRELSVAIFAFMVGLQKIANE